jgi:hypothetical protein
MHINPKRQRGHASQSSLDLCISQCPRKRAACRQMVLAPGEFGFVRRDSNTFPRTSPGSQDPVRPGQQPLYVVSNSRLLPMTCQPFRTQMGSFRKICAAPDWLSNLRLSVPKPVGSFGAFFNSGFVLWMNFFALPRSNWVRSADSVRRSMSSCNRYRFPLASFGSFCPMVVRPRNPDSITLASVGRFPVLAVRPRNPYSFTLASFGRFRMLLPGPRNPYSFTLASFGRFQVLAVRPRNPYSFTLASFGSFRMPLAKRRNP